MPFTPAHPAIILPFLRIRPDYVSGTALVIGSTAPDFEYFLKMSVNSYYSHSLLAVLYFNIPITLLLSFLFHLVIKKNLIENLPGFVQRRLYKIKVFDFVEYFKSKYWVVIFSAGFGALSHIFWDSFTHNDGYFAQRISFYRHVFIPFDGVRYPLFYGLQQISTFAGLLIVLLYLITMKPVQHIKTNRPSFFYWLLFAAIIAIVLFLRFYFSDRGIELGNFVVSSVSSIMIAMVIGGLFNFRKSLAL